MQSPHFALVAGETSGDFLGAELIQALKKHYPQASFSGIAGPSMRAAGCQALFATEAISVMGILEVIPNAIKILTIRRRLIKHYVQQPPDVFIGIDAPDFNLSVETTLKQQGIKTVHYVSPTIWAWRPKRIFKIKAAVDLILTLLPFEAKLYKAEQIAVKYVGHALADRIPLVSEKPQARQLLGLPAEGEVIALLPGSRMSEVKRISRHFIAAAELYRQQYPNTTFIAAMANETIEAYFAQQLQQQAPDLAVLLMLQQAQQVLAAADAVVLVCGTAALETMLIKRPMVVTYRANPLSVAIARRLIKTNSIALPNILANKALVPELIQHQVTAKNIVHYLKKELHDQTHWQQKQAEFTKLHQQLRQQASTQAALAVQELLLASKENNKAIK